MIPYELKALLDGLDQLAFDMETKWGVGRLDRLVNDDLRLRFRRQANKLQAALAARDPAQIQRHATGMRLAWITLDAAATEAGAPPLIPDIWEIQLANGNLVALVRTNAEAIQTIYEGRYTDILTTTEIANLINHFRDEQIKPNYSPVNPVTILPGTPVKFDLDDPLNDPLPF